MNTTETNKKFAEFLGWGTTETKVYFNQNCTDNDLKFHND